MPEYPIFVKLSGLPVLIVGGGKVALRKARGLLECGALVTVLSPEFEPGFESLPGITKISRLYAEGWLSQPANPRWRLVFAATNNPQANGQVGTDAAAAGIFCCRCDDAGQGEFTGAAIARRGLITIALSTGGASPALAAEMTELLANGIPQYRLEQAILVDRWRPRILASMADPLRRQAGLKLLNSADLLRALQEGGIAAGEQWLSTRITLAAGTEQQHANQSQQAQPQSKQLCIQEMDD